MASRHACATNGNAPTRRASIRVHGQCAWPFGGAVEQPVLAQGDHPSCRGSRVGDLGH
jgi:hypothetical protein